MVIIDTLQFSSVEEYVQSLSKRARHELTLIRKRNADIGYRQTNEFENEKMHQFMRLWERQLIRGKPIQWAYPVGSVEDWYRKKELILLEAYHLKTGETIALHFLRKHNGFWEAGPPMWDKAKEVKRHLGTYMWFHMVFWGIENKLGIINFGGGVEQWRDMIRRRKEFKNPLYKWRFIPRSVKENPDLQPDYEIVEAHGIKTLITK